MQFHGRLPELKILRDQRDAKRSGFVPVYGRRRVGKSELIIRFMEGKGVYFVGKQAPGATQIREFLGVSARALDEPLLADARASTWKEALSLVTGRWAREKKGRLVLALDEFQWMAQASPELPSTLQELWDRDWSKSGQMLLILCGSYLGFMEKAVLGRESPLFGRRTGQIHLRPFDHRESAAFHRDYSEADLARTYGICGGVPLYLEAWNQHQSVEQNIARLFLDETSILAREPDFLLREELRDLTTYHALLMEMAGGSAMPGDIAARAGIDPRTIHYHLGVLCDLGYVARHYPVTGKRPVVRAVRYRLDDPVLRFWFRFVFPNQSLIRAMGPQRAFADLVRPHLDSWFGDCFERLCRECLPLIYAREGVNSAFETGQYWDSRVQINVVGVRKDQWIDLGECKWGEESPAKAAAELEAKISLFSKPLECHNRAPPLPEIVDGPAKTTGRRAVAHTPGPLQIMTASKRWTRDELLVALNLYHKLTFGQLHARQPVVVALANKLGRGGNSVAMKLCNFASLDPALKLRGKRGLAGASALDRAVWNEFHANLNEAAQASEEALRKLFGANEDSELEVIPQEGVRVKKSPPSGPTETMASVKVRRGQEYFRDAVLNNFGGHCGVTSLAIRELLVASHILPWGTHAVERLNVRNGLCLSRLHDAAFDCGLIAFDDKFRLMLSPRLKAELPQRSVAENFGAYEGEALRFPVDSALPELAFLSQHRATIFRKS